MDEEAKWGAETKQKKRNGKQKISGQMGEIRSFAFLIIRKSRGESKVFSSAGPTAEQPECLA